MTPSYPWLRKCWYSRFTSPPVCASCPSAALTGTGKAAPDKGPADYAVLVLGLLATILVTALVTRTARRALKDATGE